MAVWLRRFIGGSVNRLTQRLRGPQDAEEEPFNEKVRWERNPGLAQRDGACGGGGEQSLRGSCLYLGWKEPGGSAKSDGRGGHTAGSTYVPRPKD